jgi:hypothetical protein
LLKNKPIKTLKYLKCDQGGEYQFTNSLNFAQKRQKREFTTIYTPQQNDVLLKERISH